MSGQKRRWPGFVGVAVAASLVGAGCTAPPETVPYVDVERYMGLWYQVAGYPFAPSDGLVGITAEYTLQDDGTVQVVNRGFEGDFDGPQSVIEGVARVVDTETNAKLAVSFPSVLGGLFEGEYWVIRLDEENYSYAVVSNSLRFTLYILSRTPQMDEALLQSIIDDLEADGFDPARIERTPQAVAN